jgi:hypothetical protein
MSTTDKPWTQDEAANRATVRDVMASPAGRRWLMSMITPTLLAASYVPGDPLGTAFNEGRRSAMLELLATLDRHAPELLICARRDELDAAERNLIKRQQETTNG